MIEIKEKEIEKEVFNPKFNEFSKSYDLFEKNKEFDKRFKTVRERTLKILKEDKFARKEKWWLLIRYWCSAGYIKIVVPKEHLFNIVSPESVFRIQRRLIQEAKKGNENLSFLLDKNLLNKNESLNQESKEIWAYKNSLERIPILK